MNTPRTITVLGVQIDLAPDEHYAGLILNADGTPAHHLILLPGQGEKLTWSKAKKWAKEAGGELPTRRELGLLRVNADAEFERDWFWSGEQHAEDSDCAWFQGFGDGDQHDYYKSAQLRARAVRRLAI